MTVSLTHTTPADGSFSATGATAWNAEHNLTAATNTLLGRQSAGAGAVEEITCTAAGRALLDDADAAAQRTTLGLGTLATQSGTFSGTSSGTNTGDQNIFQTIAVSGQSNVVADSTADTLTLVAGANIAITTNATTDAITIAATGLTSGTVTSVNVSGGTTGLSFSGGPITTSGTITAGGTLALANGGTGATTQADARTNLGLGTLATQSGTFSGTSSGTNTGDQNLFQTIAVSGQSDVVADSTADTLTLVAGTNVTITTNAATDTITISASGGGSATAAIGYTINGGGATITTGLAGNGLSIPFNATITAVTMQANTTGSIVIDIWKDSYANFPPTVADSICASAKPTITSSNKSQNSTLTGWTTSISAGDILYFNVDSVSSISNVVLTLTVTKT